MLNDLKENTRRREIIVLSSSHIHRTLHLSIIHHTRASVAHLTDTSR